MKRFMLTVQAEDAFDLGMILHNATVEAHKTANREAIDKLGVMEKMRLEGTNFFIMRTE